MSDELERELMLSDLIDAEMEAEENGDYSNLTLEQREIVRLQRSLAAVTAGRDALRDTVNRLRNWNDREFRLGMETAEAELSRLRGLLDEASEGSGDD